MSKKYNILLSPIFIIGLLILVVNDHFLKYSASGFITGKLSDFVGLFLFGLFWIVLIPRQKSLVLTIIALGFIFWKTELSSSLIRSINDILPFSIDRTVDHTDLVALLILPFSVFSYDKYESKMVRLSALHLIPAFIVFTATSYVHPMIQESSKLDRLTIESFDFEFKISDERFTRFINRSAAGEVPLKFGRFEEISVDSDTLLIHYVSDLYVPIDSIDGDYLFAKAYFQIETNKQKTNLDLIKTEAYVRNDNIEKDLKNLMQIIKNEIKYVSKNHKN